ncbi:MULTISPECIES: AI-2E family transporter [Maribellus]|uniref:AI-2E family transporter n=1 Tax=Maribellus comscasis TaxID=2681766 RepID=A0A6I6K0P5_9BACT|nr:MULTISPECIES: AI-2E family transporter [Maribellus]MCG6190949.1 AI-2E family transporter [Maribellus maritimus]QGY46127.1 AI-2E family transporter [Maribellus comscasis]
MKIPVSVKAPIIFIGLFAFFAVMYIGKGIIIPIIFATIIAIVLHPVVKLFIRLRINRVLSIIIALFLAFLTVAALGTFLFSQASRFSESLPELADKFTEILNQTIIYISEHFNLSHREITAWITKTKNELSGSLKIGQTIFNVGSELALLFLIPVYVFMILFYKPILIEFLRRLFGKSNRNKVNKIINQIKTLIQRYLIGLLLQVAIISAIYSIGLLILGIEYAIILGIIGAFLNLIPYLGSIIAASLPMIIAIVTKSSPWFSLLVLALYIVTQFIDNNFITPRIVGSKVKLNALASIVAVIVFAALWGIQGMLIAIPLTAIAKLIFDNIKPLKPWGLLLGDTMPEPPETKPALKE